MKRRANFLLIAIMVAVFGTWAFAVPSVDGLLSTRINASPLSLTPVVITFDHKVGNSDFLMLRSLGINGGRYLQQLPIVLGHSKKGK